MRCPTGCSPLARAAKGLEPGDLSRFLPPDDGSGRASAVLIAFTETPDGPSVLLIERAADMRTHAGQVAFPGGAADPADPHRVATALREAEEEVGLDPATVHVVAELPEIFLPPSGFVVTPVLAWWSDPHPVAAVDPAEVAGVAVVPVAELADPANRFRVVHPSGWLGLGFDGRRPVRVGVHRRTARPAAAAGRLGPAVGREPVARAAEPRRRTGRTTSCRRLAGSLTGAPVPFRPCLRRPAPGRAPLPGRWPPSPRWRWWPRAPTPRPR